MNPEFCAQIGQDLFVLEQTKYKQGGVFIDIGCERPKTISNTYVLETYYNWTGLGVDLIAQQDSNGETWEQIRPKTKVLLTDALNIDYVSLFKENNLPEFIDYLSIDLEPPEITLECLMKIPFDKYKFKCITFETDEYREGGDERKNISRAFLHKKGYQLFKSVNKQDDFYILS
jgi:hypothetical protein